jgi:hypothetical protein
MCGMVYMRKEYVLFVRVARHLEVVRMDPGSTYETFNTYEGACSRLPGSAAVLSAIDMIG